MQGNHHTKYRIYYFGDKGHEGQLWFTKQVFDFVPGMGYVPKDGKLLADLATAITSKAAADEFEANFDAPPPKMAKVDTEPKSSDSPQAGTSSINKKAGPANKFLKPFDMKSFSSVWASKG
jgi:hypothetical protein